MIDVDKSESDRKKADRFGMSTEELFVKSFGAYSFSVIAHWLTRKYEIDAFVVLKVSDEELQRVCEACEIDSSQSVVNLLSE